MGLSSNEIHESCDVMLSRQISDISEPNNINRSHNDNSIKLNCNFSSSISSAIFDSTNSLLTNNNNNNNIVNSHFSGSSFESNSSKIVGTKANLQRHITRMFSEDATGTNAVAIDNKIEQAMDLVKSHLMIAVREEVEVLKEKIAELMDRINQLELENTILKANVSQETLSQLSATLQTATVAVNPTTNVTQQQQQQQPLQSQPPQPQTFIQQQQQQQNSQPQATNTSNGPVS